MRWIKITIKK